MIRKHTLPVLAAAMLGVMPAASAMQDNWGYSGSNGPSSWSSVAPACSAGMQSPIVISGTEPVVMHRLETLYNVSSLSLRNEGNTVKQNYERGSILRIGSKVFLLEEFHFHTPGEHQILDRSFPMEIHFTHRSMAGELAVISVLVNEGQRNAAAEELLPHLPVEPGQSMNLPSVKINARDFMPNDKAYYRYMGSLSHPPCTGGVSWYVMKNPIEFSKEQIAQLKGLMGNNARPVQPRGSRMILDAQPQ